MAGLDSSPETPPAALGLPPRHHSASQLVSLVLAQERGYCPRHLLLKAGTAGCLKSFTEFSSKYIYNLINFIVLFQIFYFPVYKNRVKFTEKGTETQFTE